MVFLILSEVEGRGKPEDAFFSSLLEENRFVADIQAPFHAAIPS